MRQYDLSHRDFVKSDTFLGLGAQVSHILVGVKGETANMKDIRRVPHMPTSDHNGEMGDARVGRGERESPGVCLLQLHMHLGILHCSNGR